MNDKVDIIVKCPLIHQEITVYHRWTVNNGELVVLQEECDHCCICTQCINCLTNAYNDARAEAKKLMQGS